MMIYRSITPEVGKFYKNAGGDLVYVAAKFPEELMTNKHCMRVFLGWKFDGNNWFEQAWCANGSYAEEQSLSKIVKEI